MEEIPPDMLDAKLAPLLHDIKEPGRLGQVFEIRNTVRSTPRSAGPGETTAELALATISLVRAQRDPVKGTLLPNASGEHVDSGDTIVSAIYQRLGYAMSIPTLVLRPGSDQMEATTSNMVIVRFPHDAEPERTYLSFIRSVAFCGRTGFGPVDQQRAVLHVGISETWMPAIRPTKPQVDSS